MEQKERIEKLNLQSSCFSPGTAHQQWALLTYLPLL